MERDKVLGLLGLANKAGKCVSGEFSTEKSIQSQKAKLVILSADASENTKKKFQDKCNYYQVPFRCYGDKESLGHSMGKGMRTSLAVCDQGFAKALLNLLKTEENH